MKTRLLSALLLSVPLLCAAADSKPSGNCTVLAGVGSGVPVGDSLMNERWNRLNFSFFDAALTAMSTKGAVVPAFFPLGAGDASKTIDTVLAQAAKEGCTRLALVSVFTDPSKDEPELVFSLRVSSIRKQQVGGGKGDPAFSVGSVEYEKEYRYPITPTSFEQVVPSRIAERAVRDYSEARKR